MDDIPEPLPATESTSQPPEHRPAIEPTHKSREVHPEGETRNGQG